MRSARSANRFGLAVILALGGALTLASFWALEVMRQAITDTTPAAPRTEPDYYVERFNLVRMSKTGEAQYDITGKRLIHNPVDDTHVVDMPVVINMSPGRPPMTSRAQRAVLDQNNSKVHLYEDVQVDRPAAPDLNRFHLASQYLLLLPDDDVMQTDKPVEIVLGSLKLTGTGMYANNATRQLNLSSNVHATYQAPAAAGSH